MGLGPVVDLEQPQTDFLEQIAQLVARADPGP